MQDDTDIRDDLVDDSDENAHAVMAGLPIRHAVRFESWETADKVEQQLLAAMTGLASR